jgi:hypothetical protein
LLKILEVAGVVLAAANSTDRCANSIILPCRDNGVTQDLIDQLDVDEISSEVQTNLFEKTEIVINLVIGERFFLDTDAT